MADIDESDSTAALIPREPDLNRLRETALFIDDLKPAATVSLSS